MDKWIRIILCIWANIQNLGRNILYLDNFYGQLLFKSSEFLSISGHYGLHTYFLLDEVGISPLLEGEDEDSDELQHF